MHESPSTLCFRPLFKLTDEGRGRIHFSRYIGGIPLLRTPIHIEVGADAAISRVHPVLMPVSSDLYWAVKRKAQSAEDVIKFTEEELKRPD